jgi:hypothetical protein
MHRSKDVTEFDRRDARPTQADEAEPKFKRGSRVRIGDYKDPDGTRSGEAIITYTHRQKFGFGSHKSYCLTMLNEAGAPVDQVAWLYEHQLELMSEDLETGKALIDSLEFGGS